MSNEVMKKDTGSIDWFGDDAAKGFENMTQEDMALPFVRILGLGNFLKLSKKYGMFC